MEKADQVADTTYGGKNKTNCSEKTVTVLSIYIYISLWLPFSSYRILSDSRYNSSLFVCGDFNIDLLKNGEHVGTTKFVDAMYSIGLYPLIDKPSRITQYSATLIDNIFTNELTNQIISGLLINDISDHLPIFSLTRSSPKDLRGYKTIRKSSK